MKTRSEVAWEAWQERDIDWRNALAEFSEDREFERLGKFYHRLKNQVQKHICEIYLLEKGHKNDNN